MTHGRQAHAGFTYVLALICVAAVSGLVAATAQVWSTARQREKERELVWGGNQIRQAIGLYYERSPGAAKKYPETLQDLLEDRRFLPPQRYLRRVYADPLTGKADWMLIPAPAGGVMGVRSTSVMPAVTTAALAANGGEWRFVYVPALPERPAAAGQKKD